MYLISEFQVICYFKLAIYQQLSSLIGTEVEPENIQSSLSNLNYFTILKKKKKSSPATYVDYPGNTAASGTY